MTSPPLPSVSVAIMAHPDRAAMVGELATQLDTPAVVVWDQIRDRHDTGIRAVEAFDPSATHHMIVQDDARVCRDLVRGVERALLWTPPDVPLCLYLGRVKPFGREVQQAVHRAEQGASWLSMRGIYWGVGVVLPVADIPELVEWYRSPAGDTVTNYDRRLSTWYSLQDRHVWYPWPSLVDHSDAPSLVNGHGRGRHAYRFAGAHVSALELDWSGPVVDLPRSQAMDAERQLRARNIAELSR